MPNFFESATGRKRLLRTYENTRSSCFDDLLHSCAVTVEDAMLMSGAEPGVDYSRIDLFKLSMPLALDIRKRGEETGTYTGGLITTNVPDKHPHAGLTPIHPLPPSSRSALLQLIKDNGGTLSIESIRNHFKGKYLLSAIDREIRSIVKNGMADRVRRKDGHVITLMPAPNGGV